MLAKESDNALLHCIQDVGLNIFVEFCAVILTVKKLNAEENSYMMGFGLKFVTLRNESLGVRHSNMVLVHATAQNAVGLYAQIGTSV